MTNADDQFKALGALVLSLDASLPPVGAKSQPNGPGVRYWLAKWLLYTLAKQDALSSFTEELAGVNQELAACRKSKARKWPAYPGSTETTLRVERIEELLCDLNELGERTMVYECEAAQEMACDDRDFPFDEDMWEAGYRWDPEYSKPIAEWAGVK
jgi:hypothetical protein